MNLAAIAPWILFGAGLYALLYLWHDSSPHPRGSREWSSAPRRLRKLFRRTPGPILPGSIVVQIGAFGIVLVALGVASGSLPDDALVWSVAAMGLASLGTWAMIEVDARRRRSLR